MIYNESFNAPFALLAVGGLLLPVLGREVLIRWFELVEWWEKL